MAILRILALIAITGIVSSCNTVSSYRLAGSDAVGPRRNAGGSYFLAKHLMVATVTDNGISISTKAVRDNSTLVQTGLDLSPTSHDTIDVKYQSGLLQSITSTNVDQTLAIIKALAEAAGTFRASESASKEPDFVITFDPFDPEDAARANRVLRKKYPHSCIEVEILDSHWSAGCGKGSLGYSAAYPERKFEVESALPPKAPGVYYRRAFNYRVHTRFNGKPQGLTTESFANLSPILRLDVDRSAFVTRKTTIVFTDGEPTQYMVDKPSELLELAKLPVAIVKAYVGGVVSAFSEHTKIQNARASLLSAQATALNNETKLFKALQDREQRGNLSLGAGGFSLVNRQANLPNLAPNVSPGDARFADLPIVKNCREATGLDTAACTGAIATQFRLANQ